MKLTERQKKILVAIIKEYMQSAQETGSKKIVEKYNLDVSSATVRNEMSKLMDLGYLIKSHVSSGRIPTDRAFRLYIKDVLDLENIDPIEEVKLRQYIFRDRFDPDRLKKLILRMLAKKCGCASFLMTPENLSYHGVSRLINYEELQEIDILRRILDLFEDENLLYTLVHRYFSKEIGFVIGEEIGVEDMEECTLIFSSIPFWKEDVFFGVLGSRRLDYVHITAIMKSIKKAMGKSLRGWAPSSRPEDN